MTLSCNLAVGKIVQLIHSHVFHSLYRVLLYSVKTSKLRASKQKWEKFFSTRRAVAPSTASLNNVQQTLAIVTPGRPRLLLFP